MFEKIKAIIGDNEEGLAELEAVSNNYAELIKRADKADNLVSSLKDEKSKMKSFIASTKKVLDIEDGEELSEDTINNKIDKLKKKLGKTGSKKEQDLLDQIANYEKVVKDLNTEKETISKTFSNKELEYIVNLELANKTSGINAQDESAAKIIQDKLRNGEDYSISYEDGQIVYRNVEGSIIKGKDGLTNKTLNDVLEEVEDNYSYLFKTKRVAGTGINVDNTGGDNSGEDELNPIYARLKKRALEQGK